VRRLQVEVVPRAVQVHRQQVHTGEVELRLYAWSWANSIFLGEAVRGVRLLRVAVPEVFFLNGTGVNFGYAQMVPAQTTSPVRGAGRRR